MSPKTWLVAVMAMVCGLATAIGVFRLAPTRSKPVEPATIPIVVAAGELPISRGEVIAASRLAIQQWPETFVPTGSFSDIEDAVARTALTAIQPGEPVLEGDLTAKDAGQGLAVLIPKGMRAYTIQTSGMAASVAGFILPGNRVDVLMNLDEAKNLETGGGSTLTLLQSVAILAVDQSLDAPAEVKVDPKMLSSVTLLVTPDQATLLDLGQRLGKLTLTLRHPEDQDTTTTTPATLAQLRGMQKDPADGPGILERMGTWLNSTKADQQEPEEKKVHAIVTLRGKHRGQVLISE